MGLLLSGCATPQHTNTLIFGTNTKLALDISQSPTNLPSITFGYKREEVVWMPLLANVDKDGKPCNPTSAINKDTADESEVTSDCLFQGNDGKDKDTYSVLASFGAKFNGEAVGSSAPSAKGGGGLAQFFATGIAARELAKRGGERLVSVQPSRELNREDIKDIANSFENEDAQIDAIIEHISPSGVFSNDELIELVENSTIPDSTKTALKRKKDEKSLRKSLINSREAIEPLFKSIPEKG